MTTILYAEDDPQVASLVRVLFERELPCAQLEVVSNGPDCLARMAAESFDLLLLDLVLPGRDGLAILSELAQRGDATPVIVISSHGQFEQTVSALRAGAIDCIDKKSGRFLDTARIVRRFLSRGSEPIEPKLGGRSKTVALLERNEQLALETAVILGTECPQLLVKTVPTRREWDRLFAAELPCDAVVVTDEWEFDDFTQILRDVRSADRNLPAVYLSRRDKLDSVIAAYALGCRDCVVQRHGYQLELARSLNHLLREPKPVVVRLAG
jgi:DNA-binding NtrC family response regulator